MEKTSRITSAWFALVLVAGLFGSGCGCGNEEENCPIGCLTGLWLTLSTPLVLDTTLDIQVTVDGESLDCSIEPTYEDYSCSKVGILVGIVEEGGQDIVQGLSLMGDTPTECTVIIRAGSTELVNSTVHPQYNISGGGCCDVCKKGAVSI